MKPALRPQILAVIHTGTTNARTEAGSRPARSGRSSPGWPMLPDRGPAAQAPATVTRDEVRRLAEDGAQLVEVLPRDEFEDEHLPGAISLPLKALTAETSAVLDMSRPVIVYCWDGL